GGQHALHLNAQLEVVITDFTEESRALMRPPLERRQKNRFNFSPPLEGHIYSVINCFSRARATRHSRSTVVSEMLIASAVSAIVKPPKNRSSIIIAFCGSTSASACKASSRAINSDARP